MGNLQIHHYLFAFAAFAVGCSSDTVRETYENEGDVCLTTGDDTTLKVTVYFPTCLSSSCDRALSTSCNMTLDGNTIRLESRGRAEFRGGTCTADCGTLAATCSLPDLPAGEYELVYGKESTTLTWPDDSGTQAFDSDDSSWGWCG